MQNDFQKNLELEDKKRKEIIARRRKKLEPYAPHQETVFAQHKSKYLYEKEVKSNHFPSIDGLEDI